MSQPSRRPTKTPKRRRPLRLEILEDRATPATFTVNSLGDLGAGSGSAGDLRYCINQANAAPGADGIQFAVTGTIALASGLTTISTSDLSIQGPGADKLTVRGAGDREVLSVSGGINVSVSGLTITGGNGTASLRGGGIDSRGNLSVSNSVITDNTGFSGGGIRCTGNLTVDGSMISKNHAQENGGGVWAQPPTIGAPPNTVTIRNTTLADNTSTYGGGGGWFVATALTIVGSTVSGNTANLGAGGLAIGSSSAAVSNSTIAQNTAAEDGGGIGFISGGGDTLKLTNVTIAGNRAGTGGSGSGGGLAEYGGTAVLKNTIVAANFKGPAPGTTADDVSGAVDASSSFNLIGAAGSIGIANNSNGNQVGTPSSPIDPKLGPLQDNGGPTKTMALLEGSPAIDAGNNADSPGDTDQRGQPRIVNGRIDIGAFEFQPPSPEAEPGQRELIASGAPDGSVRIYQADASGNFQQTGSFTPFPGFAGAVRSAAADVNGDGVADQIYGIGPGGGSLLRVVSGKDGSDLAPAFATFESTFTGGIFVAAGDIDGDGKAEIVVSPDVGGGGRIQIFSLQNGQLVQRDNFFGIDDLNFRGGARVALGDVNGDGKLDLIVGAGFLGGPRIAIFDGAGLLRNQSSPPKLVADFFAFPGSDTVNLRNGVFVAAGDADGDGKADLIFGGGPGGAPRVFVLSGATVLGSGVDAAQNNPLANYFVGGDTSSRGGVRVAAKDADGDGRADVVVGSGENLPSSVRSYLGKSLPAPNGTEPAVQQTLDPFGSTLAAGVFVG